jgi:hypothetical protein
VGGKIRLAVRPVFEGLKGNCPFWSRGIWPKGNVKTVPSFVRRGGQKMGHPQDQKQGQDKSTAG